MRMNYRNLVAAILVAASVIAGGVSSRANAASSDAMMAYEGRWNGRTILDCAGVTAPMEIVIQDGDMSGQVTVRGQGQGDGTYTIFGYIDRKGRISGRALTRTRQSKYARQLVGPRGQGPVLWSGMQRKLESRVKRSDAAAG